MSIIPLIACFALLQPHLKKWGKSIFLSCTENNTFSASSPRRRSWCCTPSYTLKVAQYCGCLLTSAHQPNRWVKWARLTDFLLDSSPQRNRLDAHEDNLHQTNDVAGRDLKRVCVAGEGTDKEQISLFNLEDLSRERRGFWRSDRRAFCLFEALRP